MRVHELMTAVVCAIDADTTLEHAAALMAEMDIGALPVLDGNHLMGMVTDRDITVRGMAAALAPDAPVSAVMSRGIHACHADEDIRDVLLDMELLQLRRVPVENDDDEFIGMLSLSDLIAACTDTEIGHALRNICRPTDEAPDGQLKRAA